MADLLIVEEWLAEAEEDFRFASVSLAEHDEFFSRICFHFQQAAEKYLKAFIVARGLEFKKIHNLRVLLNICKKEDMGFGELQEECLFLNAFYVDTRYPAFWPVGRTREEAQKAQEAVKAIGDFVKEKLRDKI
jgi:HEPN domain-containing protein